MNVVLPAILFVAFLAVAIYVYVQKQGSDGTQVCTQDVLECDDGSFVSRNPNNNCEFNECANGGASGTFPEGTETQTHELEISGFAFVPNELTMQVGDTVTWTNKDAISHTVTSDSGTELASEYLSKGESYSHTFNTVGNFDYHCIPHQYMKGTITVE